MIRISCFVHTVALQEFLQTLSFNKYNVIESKLSNSKTFDSSDVIIADVQSAKKLSRYMKQPAKSLILFFDEEPSATTMYQTATKLEAFAVITTHDIAQLAALIDQAYQAALTRRTQQFAKGKTIGVISTKGGVGKSFIAYHLAALLRQFTPEKPLLIDLGVPMGSARSLLHVQAEKSWQVLRPLLATGKDLTSSRLQAQMTTTISAFSLLNAPADLNQEPLTTAEVANLTKAVAASYPITVVDVPTVTPGHLEKMLSLFDLVIWVLTPDANSLAQTLELFPTLRSRTPQSVIFACNQVDPQIDQQLINSLGTKLSSFELHTIDNDPEAIKVHQRKFELLSDETLIVTNQLIEFAKKVFFHLSEQANTAKKEV